jgi:hypothetical protein
VDFGIDFAVFPEGFSSLRIACRSLRDFLPKESLMTLTTEVPSTSAPEEATARVAQEIVKQHRSHLRDLEILVTRRGIILHGLARSYYGKQLAFHEVSRRLGMRVIANHIVVAT